MLSDYHQINVRLIILVDGVESLLDEGILGGMIDCIGIFETSSNLHKSQIPLLATLLQLNHPA